MKKTASSSSSRMAYRVIMILAYLMLLTFSITMASSPVQKCHDQDHLHSCESVKNSRSASVICYQLQRIRHCPPFTPPSKSSSLGEIDPRYGVEKRLVPSGPNPLHN